MANVEEQMAGKEREDGQASCLDSASLSGDDDALYDFLSKIEGGFKSEKYPEHLMDVMLSATCSSYKADWAGVVIVDLDMGTMAPYYWFRAGEGSMAETPFKEQTFSEDMRRWVEALENNQTVRLINIEEINDLFPDEYEFYRSLNIQSVIAAPFYRGATGFLVVKNPRRLPVKQELLQLAAQVIAGEAREKKLRDARGTFVCPEEIKDESDVIIHLFGRVKVVSAFGIISSAKLTNTVMGSILRILTLKGRPMSVKEIAPLVEKSRDQEKTARNLRHHISTFRKETAGLFGKDKDLIITVPQGYQLNPELNIITDLSMFEMYSSQARKIKDLDGQIRLLEKAVNLFKGDVLPDTSGAADLLGDFYHYKRIYSNVLAELCERLYEKKDFETLHRYSAKALNDGLHEMIFYYWGIRALFAKKSRFAAAEMLQTAKEKLDEESYNEILTCMKTGISPETGV